MSGVQLPGPICAFLDALAIDTGTMCRSASPIPGPHGATTKAPSHAKKKDIALDEARLIVAEAATWKGTPYSLVGEGSVKGTGGDCSGTTQKIYNVAKCPYRYQTSHEFPAYARKSGLFRELRADEAKQDGDILSWSSHMAIYSSFATDSKNATTERTNKQGHKWTQTNDMWTASHPARNADDEPPPYSPAQMYWWKLGTPRVFRYLK
jgi:hypothetical protein